MSEERKGQGMTTDERKTNARKLTTEIYNLTLGVRWEDYFFERVESLIVAAFEEHNQQVIKTVEAEREACAQILDNADVETYCGSQIAELARQIRARGYEKNP